MAMTARAGHTLCMFLRAASLFRLLNALLASTNIAASTPSSSKAMFIACIAASIPDIGPAQSCMDPAALWMSSEIIDSIALPMIRLSVSATPIGRTPGFLFSAMSLHAVRLSIALGSTYSVHRRLVIAATASQRSSE